MLSGNHCDYALSESGNLRRHLKKHIGEKTNSANLDPHTCPEGKNQTNVANATMHPLTQAI